MKLKKKKKQDLRFGSSCNKQKESLIYIYRSGHPTRGKQLPDRDRGLGWRGVGLNALTTAVMYISIVVLRKSNYSF